MQNRPKKLPVAVKAKLYAVIKLALVPLFFLYFNAVSSLAPKATTLSEVKTAVTITTPQNEFLPQNGSLHIGSGSPWAIDLAPSDTENYNDSLTLNTDSEKYIDSLPYPNNIEDHDGEIVTVSYGSYDLPSYVNLKNGGQVRNCTSIENSFILNAENDGMPFEIDKESSLPQVLIYHTHTTESFEPYSRDFYDRDFCCKTTDSEKNMIAVGESLKKELENAGICVLHDTSIHDLPSYNASYQSSRQTVSDILAQYPSIKVVLDLHRDAIEKEDGTRLNPVAVIDGKRAAQIMIISCADNNGNIPNFRDNLRFACALQSEIESDWKGLARPVLFDYRFYNQDLLTGSLLIEIGSHASSLDEAKYSASLLGKSLAKLLAR